MFSFLFFFFLNFIGAKLQVQRADTQEQEMNGIEMHDGKNTKNKLKKKENTFS